jgi:protein arginine kinase activator
MLCLICKEKPATEHFALYVGDKLQKLDLCDACAQARAANSPDGFASDELITALGIGGAELKCSSCGFTQADFKKFGRLGCPACYKTFSKELRGALPTMHKGTRHTGKVPGRIRLAEIAGRRKTLEDELSLAVFLENSEDAARTHDEIKRLSSL